MPSNRPKHDYSADRVHRALNAVAEGVSYRNAAGQFGVPKSTIHSIAKGISPAVENRRMGPATVLSKQEERQIAEFLISMAKRGFPRKKSDLMHMVAEIVKKDGRPTPFISGLPVDGFYRGFLKRNQDVVERTAETIHSGRAIVNRESINH